MPEQTPNPSCASISMCAGCSSIEQSWWHQKLLRYPQITVRRLKCVFAHFHLRICTNGECMCGEHCGPENWSAIMLVTFYHAHALIPVPEMLLGLFLSSREPQTVTVLLRPPCRVEVRSGKACGMPKQTPTPTCTRISMCAGRISIEQSWWHHLLCFGIPRSQCTA
jgi:hypothetical protein